MNTQKVATDSLFVHDFLNKNYADNLLCDIENEVVFKNFTINGNILCRTGCFQGQEHIEEKSVKPWLRCPSIEKQEIMPLTPSIKYMIDLIYEKFGHRTNIVKIQKYLDGNSYITDHSDKIIDLEENVPIYNYRIGDSRSLILTNKSNKKDKILVMMKHNSLFVMGLDTNNKYQHGIAKESDVGISYSFIFRSSVSYIFDEKYIFGQRNRFKTLEDLKKHIEECSEDRPKDQDDELIKLFSIENKKEVDLSLYKSFCEKTYFV